jgi:hypothetical protein
MISRSLAADCSTADASMIFRILADASARRSADHRIGAMSRDERRQTGIPKRLPTVSPRYI